MSGDGGSAFPWYREWENTRKGYMESESADGMSLRDYFAVRAPMTDTVLSTCQRIAGDRTESQYDQRVFDAVADYAYRYADAMLRRRER